MDSYKFQTERQTKRERIEKKEERDRELELKYENFILQGL